MSAMTFDSSPFPVAKLSLYSACSSGGGGGRRWDSVWQMGESVFLWRLRSPSHLNQLFCNLHDLWIALFTDNILPLHYNEIERECEAISGKNDKTARNCLVSTLNCIVMQMSKVICEKGYWVQRVFRTAFAETPNHCRIIRLGKSNLCWSRTN